jgi:hypothetical protein
LLIVTAVHVIYFIFWITTGCLFNILFGTILGLSFYLFIPIIHFLFNEIIKKQKVNNNGIYSVIYMIWVILNNFSLNTIYFSIIYKPSWFANIMFLIEISKFLFIVEIVMFGISWFVMRKRH